LSTILVATAASCSFSSQGTPEGYVRYCVRLIDRDGIYADQPEWKEKKEEVLSSAKSISTMDDAHSLVEEALSVAGGKHSFLMAPVKDTASYDEFPPEVEMLENGIASIVLPAHSGVKVSDSLYIHSVLGFIKGHMDAKGFIIDLADNNGGNMYPMITSVSPLIPEGIVISFKSRNRTTPISLEYVIQSCGMSPASIGKAPESTPVAILTGGHTASSGEATLLSFRGLDKVRTFGSPSAGYASSNMTYPLADGYKLVITTASDLARTGEVFCEDPIEPDVDTETPMEDAIAWIESMNRQ